MAKTTKFRKVASGGIDQGDASLNTFGMVPVIQKSVGVSAGNSGTDGDTMIRIAVMPQDGGEILEILTIVNEDIATEDGMLIDFGTSANTSAFGVITVSAFGRYKLPLRNYFVSAAGSETATMTHASAFTVTAGGTTIVAVPSTSDTAAAFICYTTMLQTLVDS